MQTMVAFRYEINAEHPLITSMSKRLAPEDADSLRVLLQSLAASLPVEMIYSDYSTHPREMTRTAAERQLHT